MGASLGRQNYDSFSEPSLPDGGAGVRRRLGSEVSRLGTLGMSVPPDEGLQPPIPANERGSLCVIDQTYESLDYDTCPNQLYVRDRMTTTKIKAAYVAFKRMIVCSVTGCLTALVAVLIDVVIHFVSNWKFGVIHSYLIGDYKVVVVLLLWATLNIALVLPAALLGSYVEPVAAGSGIPQVKCYLNGVKVSRVVRIKTLVCKAAGVTSSVLGGLLVGKEGPMIHSGAVVAAGVSQGKSTSFGKDFNFFHSFREDHEKRDFVACGAAAGVSAAFGAPIGGVLFALEEGASFWQLRLTWNSFVAAGIATAVVNAMLSLIYNTPQGGVLDFGTFANLSTNFIDYPVFFVMAIFCGLCGAAYNGFNRWITVLRMRHVQLWWQKVLEAALVAALTGLMASSLIFIYPDCKPPPANETQLFPVNLTCDEGTSSMTARLFLATPESSMVMLFHDPVGTYGVPTLVIHFLLTSVIACYTYGLGVPSGLFIPSLLNGASFGRLVGVLMRQLLGDNSEEPFNEGKYALAGAAGFLASVVRMALSLVCILMECCGSVTFTVTLMFIIFIAKYIGDRFNHGLYDVHIRLSGIPFLESRPDPQLEAVFARQIVSSPVVCLRPVESVRRLLIIARLCSHNGFPVVWNDKVPLTSLSPNTENATSSSTADRGKKSSVVVELEENASLRQRSAADSGFGVLDEVDIIDEVLKADPHVLKGYYENLNTRVGLTSDAVTTHLLTDSCINRFSNQVPEVDEDKESSYWASVSLSREASIDESGRFQAPPSDDNAGAAEGQVHWYNTQPAPADLDSNALSTLHAAQGILCGLVLRSQIMVMLKNKMFIERSEYLSETSKDLRVFQDAYPRYYDLEAVDLTPEDLDCHVDFRPYMNPAPYTVSTRMTFPRAFHCFRTLGLRHQVMVNNRYNVVGMVTRKDLVKLYTKRKKDDVTIYRMKVHEKV